MEEEKGQNAAAAPITSENVDLSEDNQAWRMPEPVFRQSSGYLPKGFEKRFGSDANGAEAVATAEVAAPANTGAEEGSAPAEPPPAAAAVTDIQPQPDLTEEFPAENAFEPAPATPQRSRGMRIFLGLLGIAAMIIFAVAFVSLIVYLFFYYPSNSQPF
jgi:hypothetical protein